MGRMRDFVGWAAWCVAGAFTLASLPGGPGGPAAAAAQSPTQAAAQPVRWQVDSAAVSFQIRNFGLPVRGSFASLEADVRFDPEHPETGTLRGTIDAATIRTGIALRDRHLKGRDYFHVEEYGSIELRSVRLWRVEAGYAGTFRLRIRDVEREVEVPFRFEVLGSTARISGSLTLDRLDYGVGRRSRILANEVTVHVVLRLRGGA